MRIGALALALSLLATGAHAQGDFDLSLDLRLVAVDARTSYLYGGLGKLRFDGAHDGLAPGRLRAAWQQPLGELVRVHLDASMWNFGDEEVFDLTEAYLEVRPYPRAGLRSRLRLGAFYAPVSLEHRAAGWTNPYLISSSAINTWVGEELRTIGAEYDLTWLGTRLGHAFDAGLVAGAYCCNDPAGILVASRGWTAHDRQTGLFSRVGQRGVGAVPGRQLFAEIDDRVGYYLGAHLSWLDRVELRLLHYDNRANAEEFDPSVNDFAWLTRFDSVGLRIETSSDWTLIAQWLKGETYVGPERVNEWAFGSSFLLASKAIGRHRLSVRADWFDTRHERSSFPGRVEETGDAFTAGYGYERDASWTFAFEVLRIASDVSRRARLGEPTRATEVQLQLSVRYTLAQRT